MFWIKTEEGHYQAGEFTIHLRKDYYYELVHKTDGVVRRDRLLEGAKRAADRFLVGQQPTARKLRGKLAERRIKAALQFQHPGNE